MLFQRPEMIEGVGQRGVNARMGQIMSRGDLVHALAEPFMPNSEMEKAHAKTPRRKGSGGTA
jgi:hypothetical protein